MKDHNTDPYWLFLGEEKDLEKERSSIDKDLLDLLKENRELRIKLDKALANS